MVNNKAAANTTSLKTVQQKRSVEKPVGSSKSEPMTDEMFEELSLANKGYVRLFQSYCDGPVLIGTYEGRYYVDASIINAVLDALL